MNLEPKTYRSHGKLLITGEYVVLDGALSLAVPTTFGQTLSVKPLADKRLLWKSFDQQGTIWFEATFEFQGNSLDVSSTSDEIVSNRLLQILLKTKTLNPDFLVSEMGFSIETHLEFPSNWGLGSSSTLINSIANWADVDAYKLLEDTFGGSGYDIACANSEKSLTYQLKNETEREIKTVDFYPSFKEQLYFVHLNQKQNSRDGIAQYRKNTSDKNTAIQRINAITIKMMGCKALHEFQDLMVAHEQLISELLKITPVKTRLFNDFDGAIKSLGAWGGDFILVASKTDPSSYFEAKGYFTVLPYSKMVLV